MAERKVSSIVCFDNLTSMLGITMCISTNRTVYSFGKHSRGAHGHRENELPIPKEINSLQAICNIDCGSFHAICLNDEGRVFTFGDNSYGQLGVSKVVTPFCYGPQDYNILQLPIIRQISAGSFYNVCLSVDNEVYSFGQNNCGQLGTGDFTDYNYPQKISTVLVESNEVNGEYTFCIVSKDLCDIDFIQCGSYSSVCKSFSGDIYVFGNNAQGQLGIGNTYNQNIPFKVLDWPDNIVDIKMGFRHTVVLTADNEVYSCGNNTFGQLGRKTPRNKKSIIFSKIEYSDNIIRIECSQNHTLCIDTLGYLVIFGNNQHNQLGLESTSNIDKPMKHPSLSNIIDISSGGYHTFVKTSNNEIYGFGDNCSSQLGIITDYRCQKTPIPLFKGNEDLWCSSISRKSNAKSARK